MADDTPMLDAVAKALREFHGNQRILSRGAARSTLSALASDEATRHKLEQVVLDVVREPCSRDGVSIQSVTKLAVAAVLEAIKREAESE